MKVKDLWKSREQIDKGYDLLELAEAQKKEREKVFDLVIDRIVEDYILSEDLSEYEKGMFASMFDAWEPNVRYKKGKKVLYRDGNVYEVIQPHESMEQYDIRELPALYTIFYQRKTSDGVEVIPPWTLPYGTVGVFKKGDLVTHNGEVWVSTHDGDNVWEPGVFGWKKRYD